MTQNLDTRDRVEALAREAAVPLLLLPIPERELILVVRASPDGPGSLDAGLGSAVEPDKATPPRDGGRSALAPTTLEIDLGAPLEAIRAIPVALVPATVAVLGTAAVVTLGGARS